MTSTPSRITEHAPQLPVSQPMWLPVRSRSSRRKWMRSLRGSTSRSYVVPLTVTVTSISGLRPPRAARVASTSARWMRYSLEAWTSDGGMRFAARTASATPSGPSAVRSTGTASTQPSATRTAPFDARGGVADAGPVGAERHRREAVLLAGRNRDPRQQLARPDRGEIDAEEELLRRHLPLAAGAGDRHPRADRDHQRRQVVRRVVRADVAADRAAVAHLDVRDGGADLAEDRPGLRLRRAP